MKCVVDVPQVPVLELLDSKMPMRDESTGVMSETHRKRERKDPEMTTNTASLIDDGQLRRDFLDRFIGEEAL